MRSVDRKGFFCGLKQQFLSGLIFWHYFFLDSASRWGCQVWCHLGCWTFTSSCNYQLHLATRSRTGCLSSVTIFLFLHCITKWNKRLIAVDVGRHFWRSSHQRKRFCRSLTLEREDNDYSYGHKRSLARTTWRLFFSVWTNSRRCVFVAFVLQQQHD